MTPEEKAITLVNDFAKFTMYNYEHAKQCALMAVDEILNALSNIGTLEKNIEYFHIPYWEEVKNEIEQL